MNGSGCKNCPVEKCETLNYRGSVCAAQRAKLGLGDPNDRTDCWQFQDCPYRNDVGWCPENCIQYHHKDYVRVVRCKDCEYYKPQNISAHWNNTTPYCKRGVSVKVNPDDFCSYGKRRGNG
jgi:hypothetical protein